MIPDLRKHRPKALDTRERKRREDQVYLENRTRALARDGHRCRVCGAHRSLETHHVKPRSKFGPKRTVAKHAASNLFTVCADCHSAITRHVLRLVILTEYAADGPVEVHKWNDDEGGYIVVRKAA